jgi:hypothetical protein
MLMFAGLWKLNRQIPFDKHLKLYAILTFLVSHTDYDVNPVANMSVIVWKIIGRLFRKVGKRLLTM